jgi:hypothetical protein
MEITIGQNSSLPVLKLQVPFKGTVGIIRMYNTSLTVFQVLQNFNADKSKYGL